MSPFAIASPVIHLQVFNDFTNTTSEEAIPISSIRRIQRYSKNPEYSLLHVQISESQQTHLVVKQPVKELAAGINGILRGELHY